MNIFEYYLTEINKQILSHKDDLKLTDFSNLKNINLEVPPEQFNYDLSCNISLVLGKSNHLNPKNLAIQLKNLVQKNQMTHIILNLYRLTRLDHCMLVTVEVPFMVMF